MGNIEITFNAEKSRYEATLDGKQVGLMDVQFRDDVVVMPHTEVDPKHEGQGVGSALVKKALDDVRENGTRKVEPLCSFVRIWIQRHKEYQDLVESPA